MDIGSECIEEIPAEVWVKMLASELGSLADDPHLS